MCLTVNPDEIQQKIGEAPGGAPLDPGLQDHETHVIVLRWRGFFLETDEEVKDDEGYLEEVHVDSKERK